MMERIQELVYTAVSMKIYQCWLQWCLSLPAVLVYIAVHSGVCCNGVAVCCHGYLNDPLGVLQDKINVLSSKILGSM